MSVQMSCDRHDAGGCVPSDRSRARILIQLEAALALGEAFQALALGSAISVAVVAPTGLLERPTISLDAASFLEAWLAYIRWQAVRPRGDDLAPPWPPSDIRIPPETDDGGTAP